MAQCAILAFATGCPTPPPPSQLPTAAAALERMKATAACGNALQAENAKIDHFGDRGRIRADLTMIAAMPARLRMDVFIMNNIVATLTTDGRRFALDDRREKRFLIGPASACNIARLTTVPLPGHALVSLLRGQAPILKHEPTAGTITWSGSGHYVVTIPSTRDATQEIHITPRPDDFNKPWCDQRMRVLRVIVRQYGDVLYDAELSDHKPTAMGKEYVDPDGLEPPIPPSGDFCDAELPRKIQVEVPPQDEEVVFTYENVVWNPPLREGVFTQPPPAGLPIVPVRCD